MKTMPWMILFSVFLFVLPSITTGKSSFSVAILVDDHVITYYDIEQKKRLLRSLSGNENSNAKVKELLIAEKLKEIYGKRLNIRVSDNELEREINSFLNRNGISLSKLKSVLRAKRVDYLTFRHFIKINFLWQKVLDARFGYKISKLDLQNSLPLPSAPVRIEKEYEFSEIHVSFQKWGKSNASLITNRLYIELKSGSNFSEAAKKFSAAKTRDTKGFVGSLKAKDIPIEIRKVLDSLKLDEVSKPLETKEGFWLFKLHKTKSYKKTKNPKYKVVYSITPKKDHKLYSCSKEFEKNIKGPIQTQKLKEKTREIIRKLMPGDSYEIVEKDNSKKVLTLCDRILIDSENKKINFQTTNRNQEAVRLSDSLLIELRRTSTIVKK